MRLNEGALSKELYSLLQNWLNEFVSVVEDEMQSGINYDTDTETMIESFKEEYNVALQSHFNDDFYDALKAIKAFSFNEIYNLYRFQEFDDYELYKVLAKLVLDPFVEQNRSVFEELADSVNDLYGMNKDVKNRSKLNYESLRRNKRRSR